MSLSRCNYRINDLGGRCQLLQGHDGGIHDVEAEVRRRVAEELAPRRADKDFMDRITKRVHDDQRLLDRLADDPPPTGLTDLPMGLYVGANRYDTDDQHVLHLWSQDGRSFDVTWPKDPPAGSPEGRPNADTEARQSEDFLTAEVTLSPADVAEMAPDSGEQRADPGPHEVRQALIAYSAALRSALRVGVRIDSLLAAGIPIADIRTAQQAGEQRA